MKANKSTATHKPNVAKMHTHEEISRLAYALYEQEGKPEGKALVHWFNAESMSESQFGYGRNHTEHDFSKDTQEDESDGIYNHGVRKPSVNASAKNT